MKTTVNPSKIIMVSIFVLAIATTGLFYSKQSKTSKNLHAEKLRNEILLSQKLQLDESILKMKKSLNDLKGINAGLDKVVAEKNKMLSKKESEIKRLMQENGKVTSQKRKIAELENIQASLNHQVEQLNQAYNKAKQENESLSASLANSQNKNNILGVNNAILKAMVADNFRVEAVKGKHDKLTINAKRTDKLMVSFEIPEDKLNGLHISIIDPEGREIVPDPKAIALVKEDISNYLTADNANNLGQTNSNRTQMVYQPEDKLQSGVYIIKIYNRNDYLGSTQLRLK